MDLFEFVERMDEKYGEDWIIQDLSSKEKRLYDQLRDEWNAFLNNTGEAK